LINLESFLLALASNSLSRFRTSVYSSITDCYTNATADVN